MSIGLFTMSKSAWMPTSNTDFQTILGPIFTLFRCFGLEFHKPSSTNRLIFSIAMVGWTVFTLGTCGYKLLNFFTSSLISQSIGSSTEVGSQLHWPIFLSMWVYTLSVFVGSWCIAKWPAAKLWNDIEDVLLNVCFSPEDVARCRKTTIQCVVGCLLVVMLNILGSVAVYFAINNSVHQVWTSLFSLTFFYSFGSSALFVCAGRIVSIAYETIASQLEVQCGSPTNPALIWKYQRQFGIVCRAAEELGRTFGYILFLTVSYTFIGFVNVSYNLLRSYQQLPIAAAQGVAHHIIPKTVRMTYTLAEHLFHLWVISHTADVIRSKALSIVPVLQNIRNDLYSRQYCADESEEVHAFLLEVSETSPTYEVLGLFTLTKQVIISLIGTTLTYLVVLCQFSAAEVKPTETPMSITNDSKMA